MPDSNHANGATHSNGASKTQGAAPNGPAPFAWPVPPFAAYAKTVLPNTPVRCEVEGLNGVVRRGLLVAMAPHEQVVWIKTADDKPAMSLAFSKFRRLTLSDVLHPQPLPKTEAHPDLLAFRQPVKFSLELDNGQQLQGKTVGYDETAYGLFLFPPVDEQGTVQRVFVPRKAFMHLNIGEPLGQVLVAQQVLEPGMVAQAVEHQAEQRNRKLGEYLVDAMVVTQDELLAAIEQQAKMPMVRLGEALVLLGYVGESQLQEALELQKVDRSQPLGKLLISMGFLTREQLTTALARKMGYPVVDVQKFPVQEEALIKVPRQAAQRLGVLPLLVRQSLMVVAAADPTRNEVLDELGFMVQGRVVAVLADEDQLKQAMDPAYAKLGLHDRQGYETLDDLEQTAKDLASGTELLETMQATDAPDEPEDEPIAQSDNTLVRLINTMIIEAYVQQVSDIHIETQPHRAKVRIRFRRDGVLSPYLELPHNYRAALVARLKIMASLDISERRKPQDGKIDFSRFSPRHRLELRIATIPTMNGLEDVVMRLLSSAKPIALDKLGLTPDNNVHLRHAISRPYGMVLCVGPTGSGKTTTLHSVLGQLNTAERKIWTAEDPVEITQPELRQVQVNPRIGWTFAHALRSFLRADPDIIMVGEIRDTETAQIAIEASLTGHLLLSTLHTNSAAETVTRLIDMGMDPFNFADSLLAVLAQRLVRRWCEQCRVSKPASAEYVQELMDDYRQAFPESLRPSEDKVMEQWLTRYAVDGQLHHHHAPGCEHCHHTGLIGRMGLHELLQVSPGIRRLIQTSAPAERILEEAFQSGWFRTLRQDGIVKVLEGHIPIEEVRANSNA
jgi:type II secretory ATPase GspE/PulE/Tfp pilus assembly ATPase PilB-like protein